MDGWKFVHMFLFLYRSIDRLVLFIIELERERNRERLKESNQIFFLLACFCFKLGDGGG